MTRRRIETGACHSLVSLAWETLKWHYATPHGVSVIASVVNLTPCCDSRLCESNRRVRLDYYSRGDGTRRRHRFVGRTTSLSNYGRYC